MSWMAARATLKMTETELTRRHSMRTVTHINALPRGDLNFEISPRIRWCLYKRKLPFCQRIVTTSPSLSSICPCTRSHHPLCAATGADTSRSDLVCHVNAPADASNVGESLCLENPLGNADEIRAVHLTQKYRRFDLLSAAFNFRSASFGRLFPSKIHICWKC